MPINWTTATKPPFPPAKDEALSIIESGVIKTKKIAQAQSIRFIDEKPVWSSTCEQCMRCVNFCPKESIYQSYGGDTKGKNRYIEPGFKPLSTP